MISIEGQVFITLKYGIFINYPSHSKIARLGKLAYFRELYRLNDVIATGASAPVAITS